MNLAYLKAAGAAALLVLAFLAGLALGERLVQGRWDADQLVHARADTAIAAAHERRVTTIITTNQRNNLEVSNDHAHIVQQLTDQLVKARAAIRAAGGLRVPASICSLPPGPEAPGDGRRDDDAAGTVALPDDTTERLLALVDEADKVTEVARSCQAWIKKHGFYGE